MNSAFELPPEEHVQTELPVEEPAQEMPADPADRELVEYERKALAITFTDDASVNLAMFIIAKLKEYETGQDKERRRLTDPLNKQIEDVSKPFNDRKAKAKLERTKLETRLGEYRALQEAQRQEAQRIENQRVEQERIRKQEEAERARKEAEAQREAGNEAAAAKLEGKAQRAEIIAATAAPTVIPQATKTTTLVDGSSLTIKEDKDWIFANGMLKGTAYYRNDPRFKDIPDEYWKLDEAAISKRVKASRGVQPDLIPGVKVIPKVSTMHRRSA